MKYVFIVPICFILLAGVFVLKGMDGWGWCIFAAILTTATTVSYKEEKEDEE